MSRPLVLKIAMVTLGAALAVLSIWVLAAQAPPRQTPPYGSDLLTKLFPNLGTGEVSPNNQFSSQSGKLQGYLLAIHGGGWQVVGTSAVDAGNSSLGFFHQLGWASYSIDYRRGKLAFPDVLAAFHKLRKYDHNNLPICVFGSSAGAHLALLLAAVEPSISCVIGEGAPTDLLHFSSQSAFTPCDLRQAHCKLPGNTGPAYAFKTWVVPSFGSSPALLWYWSPLRVAKYLHMPILLGSSAYDELVPQVQMAELAKAATKGLVQTDLLAGSLTNPLDPGSTNAGTDFTHANVTLTSLNHFAHLAQQLLAKATVNNRSN